LAEVRDLSRPSALVGAIEVSDECGQKLRYRAEGDWQNRADEQAREQLRDVPGPLSVQALLGS
jgi:hypothetical protein